MNESEPIDSSQLRPGPIRHKSLPPNLLELVRSIYEVVGAYLNTTLEQFEIGFMRDANPEHEVTIWCNITTAWVDYHERFLNEELLPVDEEQQLFAALIAISTGVDDVTTLNVPVEVGRRLLQCYDDLRKE